VLGAHGEQPGDLATPGAHAVQPQLYSRCRFDLRSRSSSRSMAGRGVARAQRAERFEDGLACGDW